jgi:hypothetical protein
MHWTNQIWFVQDEIKSLEEARFVLNKGQSIFPQILFEKESSILINRPMDEMSWPTSHNGCSSYSAIQDIKFTL